MTHFPFATQPHLLAVAQGYIHQDLIADRVLPRVRTGKKEFRYIQMQAEERLSVPDTLVSRKGRPGEVYFQEKEAVAHTTDYALDSMVPQDDIDNAEGQYDPLANTVAGLTELLMLDREVRVANMLGNDMNYLNDQKETLSSAEKFSDANADPLATIGDASEQLLHRPNVMLIGQGAWKALSRHPKILKAVHQNTGDSGIASSEAVARLFDFDEVLIGRGWHNTAAKGQDPAIGRIWGNDIVLMYRNPNANLGLTSTFAVTAQYQDRLAGSVQDQNIGMRGGQRVRVGESVAELIIDPSAGYLIKGAV